MKKTIIRSLSLIVSAIIMSSGMSLAVRLHWWYELNTEITTITEEVEQDALATFAC